MPEEKTKEKKKWQPVNIILGLLIIGLIFYFSQSLPPPVIILRIIPAIILILTRKNNFFSFLILLIFGLTVFFITTIDGFLILGSAIYMLISTILRMFKVRWYAPIGLAATLIIALGLYCEYATTFVSESNLDITKKINNDISIELTDDTGKTSDIFFYNRGISPRGKGLQPGTYVYQVMSYSRGIVVPMSLWPKFKIKTNGDIAQRGMVINWLDLKNVALHGGFNREGWFPLDIDKYTIQLIKIEKNIRIIIAESNFSIVPYDKQTLSKLTAYLTANDGPEKYYDSYTKKGNASVSVTVWVQSPPGEVIGGKLKSYMENSEGGIDKTSWIGVGEDAFRTDVSGEPVKLRNLSGNPLPGVYHYEIIVDGNVLFNLKYNCF